MPPETRYLQAPDIRALAHSSGVNPSKSKGQNFVIDANTVRKIVSLSGAQPGEHVLEVGPGFGSLTVGLVGAGCQVTAIEIDPRLAHALPGIISERVPGGRSNVIEADALTVTSVPDDVVSLIANLPYNVAVPVLIHLLEIHPGFRRVLVMVQAEVGWRLAAAPGTEHYGAPSVKVAWWGEWSVESTISRRVFWPEPRVDSVLVGMRQRQTPGDERLRKTVFRLVDAGFHTRRKMSRAALSDIFGSSSASSTAIEKAGLNPESRCETWSLSDFVALARVTGDLS
ncbi:MAG: 16S rRNA (adenine(1518)-N(6)/adenine(1519)-N(6))-dimethyltransferase RsmA [Pontimonas sp.]